MTNDERMTKPEAQTPWEKTLASQPAGNKPIGGMAAIRHSDFELLSSFVIRASDFGLSDDRRSGWRAQNTFEK
jgi:hypothetical protein